MGVRWSDVVQLAACWLTLLVLGSPSAIAAPPPAGGRNREISVPRGLSTYIRSGDLGLDFRPDPVIGGVFCVVSVVGDDPGSLRVGRVYPEVFPCDCPSDVVRYVHNGNPTLDVDRIRLVIRQATNSETYIDEVVLTVRITPPIGVVFVHKSSSNPSTSRSSCSFPPSELTVDSSKSSMSAPIDASTLRFRYDFTDGAVCTLTYSDRQSTYFRSQSLNAGYLVSADGTPVVGNLSIDCRDFITSGYRYRLRSFDEGGSNATVIDVDYVPLTAEVEDFTAGNGTASGLSANKIRHPKIETLFFPVRISTGVRNQPPEVRTRRDSSSSVPIVWIDQFLTLPLTGDLLSAVDDETSADDIVFTVLKPPTHPDDGYLVDVRRDAWKPIRSFSQRDVSEGRIAFQPASREPASDRIVDVELSATDGRFTSSRPVRVRIGIRRVEPASPKVTRNAGLVLGSGQSRRIGIDQLRIYDVSGRSDWIQIHVLRAGPRHGTIKVRGRVADAFNVSDLERREVIYEHDGGGSADGSLDQDESDEDDSIMLRISNFKYSTRARFPIYVIRNSWRTVEGQRRRKFNGLGTNVATEVRQNGYAQITTLHLDVAGDSRAQGVAVGETIVYDVVKAPQYGEILKMFRPMTRGRHTSRFTQLDLDRGHVWYHHTAGGDANKSIATGRDYFRFVLRPVTQSADDDDDDDGIDNKQHPEVVLQHDVIVRPHELDLPPRIGRNSTRTLTMSTLATLVPIGRDILSYVDGENPVDDVLYVVTCQPYIVRAADSGDHDGLVTDDAGQIVYFDKTIASSTARPQSAESADNITSAATIFPPLRTFTQSMIDADLVSYRLPVTSSASLSSSCADRRLPVRVRFSFSVSDLHGNFAVDQSFDINLLPSVSSAFSAGKLTPMIESAARRLPSVSTDENGANDDRSTPVRVVDVNEGEQVVVTVDHVIDESHLGQLSTSAVFDVIKSPLDGVMLVNGRETRSFTMSDLRSGSVSYRHTGGETGQIRRTDSVILDVRSNGEKYMSTDLIDVHLNIRPVDNSPPELTVGGLVVIGDDQLAVPLTAEAVSASDVDTDPDRLMFVVVETPTFGRLDISRTRGVGGATTTMKVAADGRPEAGSTVATRRGRSSNERRTGARAGGSSKRAVTAFSMSDLRSGAVRYVRRSNAPTPSDASRTSSVFDSFKVYASDGHRNSAVGQVEIAFGRSQRQHPSSSSSIADLPALNFEVESTIYVEEGGDRVFEVTLTKDSASTLGLGVESLPFDSSSSSDPVVSLTSPPLHGKVILSIQTGTEVSEVNLDTVAVSDLSNPNVRLIYRHEGQGQASLSDQFSLSLSDGYRRSSPQTVRVDVRKANRLPPTLVSANKLFIQGPVDRAIITQSHLVAEDQDSPVDKIRYVVVVPPTSGHLERQINSSSSSSEVSERVGKGNSFSQLDIDAGRMRYVTSGMVTAPFRDSVVFRLTDGTNSSPSTDTLDIEIVAVTDDSSESTSGMIAAEFQRIVIADGFGTSLTTSVLGVASDDVDSLATADFRYRIVKPPQLGHICLQYNESATVRPVTLFTRLDVEAGRVFYRLHRKPSSQDATAAATDSSDSIEYQLESTDGDTLSAVRRLRVDIKHDDDDAEDDDDDDVDDAVVSPPTLTLDVNVPLTVIHGYRATLSAGNLHMSVSGRVSVASRLVYTVVEPPKHGQIVKTATTSGTSTREGIRTFTQSDVDAGLIEYKSDSSDESMMDYFLFSIGFDSTSSRQSADIATSSSAADQKPLFFSILIQPVTKIPPKVVRRQSPDRLVRLDDSSAGSSSTAAGGRFGFMITDEHLKAVHPLFEARDVVYQLKTRPQYGYLEHLGSRRQIRRKFTQRDVDEKRIAYVLNDRTRATNDSFTYRIVDLNRNAIDDQRMPLEWSIIQFSQSQYIVCEDAQQLAVSIVRTGSVERTAAVTVRLKSLTAKESTDFKNKSDSVVEFPPGAKEVKWMVEIVNDGLQEGNDEKFKVLLENTTNSILGQIDKTQVHLIDFEDGECMEYIGMITKHNPDSQTSSGGVVDINGGRLNKGKQRHRQVGFNKQTNAFRGLDDQLPDDDDDDDDDGGGLELGEAYDGKDDVTESDDYDDYNEKPNEDATSSLLSSDLAFYMPPESGSQPHQPQGGGTSVASRKNKKSDKSGTTASSGKRTKGQSSENIRLAVPQPCSRETQGLLFFDLQSSKMYRCTGQRWEHWGWGLTGATEAPPVIPAAVGKQSTRRRKQTGPKSSTEMRGEVRTVRHDISAASRDVICPTNWTIDGATCYQLIAERTTWNEAERRCQSLGGHVTGIKSWQDLSRLSRIAGQRQFWTGIRSEPVDDDTNDDIIMRSTTTRVRWTNADGTRPTYFNWRPLGGAQSDTSSVVACSTTGDCGTGEASVDGPGCVAAIGTRLQFVSRPCSGVHRLRAICAARPQQLALWSSSSSSLSKSSAGRRRKSSRRPAV